MDQIAQRFDALKTTLASSERAVSQQLYLSRASVCIFNSVFTAQHLVFVANIHNPRWVRTQLPDLCLTAGRHYKLVSIAHFSTEEECSALVWCMSQSRCIVV